VHIRIHGEQTLFDAALGRGGYAKDMAPFATPGLMTGGDFKQLKRHDSQRSSLFEGAM